MGQQSMEGQTDAAILRVSLTDPEVFGELFTRHGDLMFGFLQQRCGVAAAEDLLSEVFCSAFVARRTYDFERENSLPWLYGIAVNLLRRHYRASARRTNLEIRLRSVAGSQRATDDVVAASIDAAEMLRQINSALTDDENEILELTVWEELTFDEASRALGVPAGTLRSRLTRARQKLRGLFAEQREGLTDNRGENRWTS